MTQIKIIGFLKIIDVQNKYPIRFGTDQRQISFEIKQTKIVLLYVYIKCWLF